MQAARDVMNGSRMEIPRNCPAVLQKIMKACWKHDPKERPEFKEILEMLREDEEEQEQKANYISFEPEYGVSRVDNTTENNDQYYQ